MQPFHTLTALAAPLDRANIDTDQLIPKQFLKRIERTGYGDFLFFDWRQTPDGKPVAGFVLNDPRYKGAQILVAGKNFACGSSREHAAWALADFGFRVVIAPSFADIFFSNAGKNGIVLVKLSEADVAKLLERTPRRFPATSLPFRWKSRPLPTARASRRASRWIRSVSSACSKAWTTSASRCATRRNWTHLKRSTIKTFG
jgi:3-isopropylmalate dehydratase small subunit